MDYLKKYKLWCENEYFDDEFKSELLDLKDDEIKDRFYSDLKFGTGGIRGIIGAGSNRINKYIIAKVTQGYANFLNENFKNPTVAIAYDSRYKSLEFAKESAKVLGANGIKVYFFEKIATTPELSYAVRELKATGGIVITASHNPSNYNGYKVYQSEGYQILLKVAQLIINEVNKVEFDKIKSGDFEELVKNKYLEFLGDDFFEKYYLAVSRETDIDKKNIKIVYTPLNGAGARSVVEVLKRNKFINVYTVDEQMIPDSNFTTVPYPNPEEESVFDLAIKLGNEKDADILVATDPDSDRVGVMAKHFNKYIKINGNQMGALLSKYLLDKENYNNNVIITTIVSSHLVDLIAKRYGAIVYRTLTGFKYIGEKISELEDGDKKFILGFEESYGYLTKTHARDKDAADATLVISEMAAFYKNKNMTLIDALDEIYSEYGYFKEELISIEFEGEKGIYKIQSLMDKFREIESFEYSYNKTIEKIDYLNVIETKLPKENVLKFIFKDQSWFAIRPSGTEPKIKIYLSITSDNLKETNEKLNTLKRAVNNFIGEV